jgi:hypothetical protein
MEMPTILAVAAGAAGASVAAGAAGAQALIKTESTRSIETRSSKLFFISSFPFRTWGERVSGSPAGLKAGNYCRKVESAISKQLALILLSITVTITMTMISKT